LFHKQVLESVRPSIPPSIDFDLVLEHVLSGTKVIAMEGYDDDIDDENEWKAIDSDEEPGHDERHDETVERDDDVDIGFRSHQFQYGAHGRNRNRTRRQNQDEAIYGVFYESDGEERNRRIRGSENAGTGPPVFVAASKSDTAPLFVAASQPESLGDCDGTSSPPEAAAAPMFVSTGASSSVAGKNDNVSPENREASETTSTAAKAEDEEKAKVAAAQAAAEAEEVERLRKEQQEADDHFLGLLEKAKARNKRSRPQRSTIPSAPAEPSAQVGGIGLGAQSQGGGLGLGAGLPSSFGGYTGLGGGGGLGLGLGREEAPIRKDPTVATWEKHTKGFGSKLLAKMGWKGSGGLGSNRRTFRGEATDAAQESSAGGATTDAPKAAAASASAPKAVKKGISRPIEVVVRPSKMGLGFGNFKEASQLKVNRRIEAEVRGFDYDAQFRKEKEEQRRKRRRTERQRYGDDFDEDGYSDDGENDDPSAHLQSSAIGSTDDLLSHQSWKARRSKRQKKTKNAVPEFIPYTELLERQKKAGSSQPVVIDMRGPSSSQSPSASPELGEELLYNVSFLLNTYENKLHSAARYIDSSLKPKIEAADREIAELEERSRTVASRLDKLERAQAIADRVQEATAGLQNSSSGIDSCRRIVEESVAEMRDVFSQEERRELRFWDVLAPTLLGPIVRATLDHWNPCFENSDDSNNKGLGDRDRNIIDSFFDYTFLGGVNKSSNKESRTLCESLIRTQLIPKLKADIEAESSPSWDPIRNPYVVLDLYEYLRTRAKAFDEAASAKPNSRRSRKDDEEDPNQIFPSGTVSEDESEDGTQSRSRSSGSDLAGHIRHELIVSSVYPKLLGAVQRWKPTLSQTPKVFSTQTKRGQLDDPLHLWVLPWLPHIDHPGLLPNLFGESKRKIKSALSVLQRSASSSKRNEDGSDDNDADRNYVFAVLDLLRPWQGIVLGAKALQKMVASDTLVLLRLARLLSSSTSLWNGEQSGKPAAVNRNLLLLFELHTRTLISDADFLSLVEGPVLAHWAKIVHGILCDGLLSSSSSPDAEADTAALRENGALKTAARMYRDCKVRILVDPFASEDDASSASSVSFPCQRSLGLLRGDTTTCRSLYSVLRMVQIYQSPSLTPKEKRDALDSLEPEPQGFRAISARRSLEEKQAHREEFVKLESRSEAESRARTVWKRKHNHSNAEPTFREVVEELAYEKGVVFRPRLGANALKDGKQTYLFGDVPMYLEDDVVFCHKDSDWRPVSLDQLMGIASNA